MEIFSSNRSFGGWTKMFSHSSDICNGIMKCSVYIPPQADISQVPVLYWLSGLTCTHENFITKAGAQQFASELGLMIVVPDTSPRGAGIEGEDEFYDLGTGAGFFINATKEKWSTHYRMEDYIIHELPKVIEEHFPANINTQGIFGHSMGGHGALTLALKYPNNFRSVSAFAPICAPSQCPWGKKAFTAYFGENQDDWLKNDANELMKTSSISIPMLIDQGSDDEFLEKELNFKQFEDTCSKKNYPSTFRMHKGYDHSYYFIASFIEDHMRFHAKELSR
jgi:S-formylglutathione hydrolase